MQLIMGIIGGISGFIRFLANRSERQAGKAQQLAADQQKTISQLEAELNASTQPHDAADKLRRGDF